MIDRFRDGDAPVFFISLKAGGFGLNLTEADHCILLDPWWNPASEAQAVDRVHRIGQKRKVIVHRLVARDTIEEKVMALKARKAKLFASVVGSGGFESAALTSGDVREPARRRGMSIACGTEDTGVLVRRTSGVLYCGTKGVVDISPLPYQGGSNLL